MLAAFRPGSALNLRALHGSQDWAVGAEDAAGGLRAPAMDPRRLEAGRGWAGSVVPRCHFSKGVCWHE